MDKQEQRAIALSQQVVVSPIEVKSKIQELLDKNKAEEQQRKREKREARLATGLQHKVLESVTREIARDILMPALEPFETHEDFQMREEALRVENFLIDKFSL